MTRRRRVTTGPSRRSDAVDRRATPHLSADDPDAPGCCQVCGLRTDLTNALHITADQLPQVDDAITEAERRRLGEHQQEDG